MPALVHHRLRMGVTLLMTPSAPPPAQQPALLHQPLHSLQQDFSFEARGEMLDPLQ